MKKLISISLATMLSLNMASSVFANEMKNNPTLTIMPISTNTDNEISVLDNVSVLSNGIKLGLNDNIIEVNGTTFFPMRDLLNNLAVYDSDITWDSANKSITFEKYDNVATFTINKKTATVNGKTIDLPFAPFIYEGKTYVPINYISSSLGFDMSFDENTNTYSLVKDGVIGVSPSNLTKPAIPEVPLTPLTPANPVTPTPSVDPVAPFVDATLYVDGEELHISEKVLNVNGQTYYPVAELTKKLGGKNIEYGTDYVTITNSANNDVVTFTKGESVYKVNGENKENLFNSDVAIEYNNTLYAPLENIADAFNYTYATDEDNIFNLTSVGFSNDPHEELVPDDISTINNSIN